MPQRQPTSSELKPGTRVSVARRVLPAPNGESLRVISMHINSETHDPAAVVTQPPENHSSASSNCCSWSEDGKDILLASMRTVLSAQNRQHSVTRSPTRSKQSQRAVSSADEQPQLPVVEQAKLSQEVSQATPPATQFQKEAEKRLPPISVPFFLQGNFSPPRSEVLLYQEVAPRVASLRSASISGQQRLLNSSQPDIHVNKRAASTSFQDHSSVGNASSFFGNFLDRRRSGVDPSFGSHVDWSSRSVQELPQHLNPSQPFAKVHLLFHEQLDFEDDIVVETFTEPPSAGVRPLLAPIVSPATATFLGFRKQSIALPETEMIRTADASEGAAAGAVSVAAAETLAPSPATPTMEPISSSLAVSPFWRNDENPSSRIFTLPATLHRYHSRSVDEAAEEIRMHREEQRKAVVASLLEEKRLRAVRAALSLGPDSMSAPPKRVFLRLVTAENAEWHRIVTSFNALPFKQQLGSKAHVATSNVALRKLLDDCVIQPLASLGNASGECSVELPAKSDLTTFTLNDAWRLGHTPGEIPLQPRSRLSLLAVASTTNPGRKNLPQQNRRASLAAPLPLENSLSAIFAQQVESLVSLTLCPETLQDSLCRSLSEIFLCISCQAEFHTALITRVALSIQHHINTGQHPEFAACHIVDRSCDHLLKPLQESPRTKDPLELLPLQTYDNDGKPCVRVFELNEMRAPLGRWEEEQLRRIEYVSDSSSVNHSHAGKDDASVSVPKLTIVNPVGMVTPVTDAGLVELVALSSSRRRRSVDADVYRGDSSLPSQPHLLSAADSLRSDAASSAKEPVTMGGLAVVEVGGIKEPSMNALGDTRRASPKNKSIKGEEPSSHGPTRAANRRASLVTSTLKADREAQRIDKIKGFGEAVKAQRLRRLQSLAKGDDDETLHSFIHKVAQGLPIHPESLSHSDAASKGKVSHSMNTHSSDDSDDEGALGLLARRKLPTRAPSEIGPRVPLFQRPSKEPHPDVQHTEIPTTPKFTKEWGSATTVISADSILTGRNAKVKKREKKAPAEVIKDRLLDLFKRYGLASIPKPGALSEQSASSLRRCSGCVFEKPHAFCTNCGLLFCIDCFYFIHRPLTETFLWYSSQNPGRIKALCTTEFMNEGNDFQHAALSIDSLMQSALDTSTSEAPEAPIFPTASPVLVDKGTVTAAKIAREVLTEFRVVVSKDDDERNHPFSTLSGGGLSDEEFHLSIENVIYQLKSRLKRNFSMLSPTLKKSAAAVAAATGKDSSPSKRSKKGRHNHTETDEQQQLIQAAIDVFQPTQLSHLLEVVSKFQLDVPPLVYRLVMGKDLPAKSTASAFSPTVQPHPVPFDATPSLTSTETPPASLSSMPPHDNDSGTAIVSWDEVFADADEVPRNEPDDDDSSAVDSPQDGMGSDSNEALRRLWIRKKPLTPHVVSAMPLTPPVIPPRRIVSVGSLLEQRKQALRDRRESNSVTEPAVALYHEESEKPPPLIDASIAPHLANVIEPEEDEEPLPTGPTTEELREERIAELQSRGFFPEAAWLRNKLLQARGATGLVLIVAVDQFDANAALLPLPWAAREGHRLSEKLQRLGYSVDVMHTGATEAFLRPTKRNVMAHIQRLQRVVICTDASLSQRFLVVVLSRGFVAKNDRAFADFKHRAHVNPSQRLHEFVAFASDTAFAADTHQLTLLDDVLTPHHIQGLCRDHFDASPVVVFDCWPIPNVVGGMEGSSEGVGFGIILGRDCWVEVATPSQPDPISVAPNAGRDQPSTGSPTAGASPVAAGSNDNADAATASSAPASPSSMDNSTPSSSPPPLTKQFVRGLCLPFAYHPTQGGLLLYYLERALEGRSLFNRVPLRPVITPAEGEKKLSKKRSKAKISQIQASAPTIDSSVTVIDLFVFVGQRVESKGVKLLLDEEETTDLGRSYKSDQSKAGGNKKKSRSKSVADPDAKKQRDDDVMQRRLSTLVGVTSGASGGQVTQRRDALSKSPICPLSIDGSAPILTFPQAMAEEVLRATMSSQRNTNPFASNKAAEAMFDRSCRRFHVEMWVRFELKPPAEKITGTSPSSPKKSKRSNQVSSRSFDEATVLNPVWRRTLLMQLQALVNGSRAITRNGRPMEVVALRSEPQLVLDFHSGWCDNPATVTQLRRLVQNAVHDAESIIDSDGSGPLFHETVAVHQGLIVIRCLSDEHRWMLTETLRAAEAKSAARGMPFPSFVMYAPVVLSLLGTNRDFRRMQKVLALQLTSSVGIMIRVEKDPNSEAVHRAAAVIQSRIRGIRCRNFLRSLQDVIAREERIRIGIEDQASALFTSLFIELLDGRTMEVRNREALCRDAMYEAYVVAVRDLVFDLIEMRWKEEGVRRRDIRQAEARAWLQLFEVPNRWMLGDDEDLEFSDILMLHRLQFRESWQRYYVVVDEFQERVRLRTESRKFVALLPKYLRVPTMSSLVQPPCDFDFASSLVVLPTNIKQLYLRAKRSTDSQGAD